MSKTNKSVAIHAKQQSVSTRKNFKKIMTYQELPNKEIPTVRSFGTDQFVFHNLLGEGAFGKVRKCNYTGKADKPIMVSSASTSSSSNGNSPNSNVGRQTTTSSFLNSGMQVSDKLKVKDEDGPIGKQITNCEMAVKLQSKYQLVKNK